MILPTKGIAPEQALITVGGRILVLLDRPKTVSRLWHEIRSHGARASELRFDWFILALDLLHILGAVELDHARVRKLTTRGEAERAS